ncbi:reverse transcriptase-like protein [Rossellomorea sp. LJF3]|uniref:reverse transcriptase-like protein n=1 Tax=Rossellomorea sp. LJF3 TaxID=3126099 RepID=UPI00300D1C44
MLEVYIDGASAGNPGPSGAGIFIKYNGEVEKHCIPLGIMDNHEAEFLACKKALEICLEKQTDTVWLKSDSQAVVHAIEKEFVRNLQYKPLLGDILNLTKQMNLFFVKWIPSKENKAADELARKAIHLN